jgi:hypothetical protein
VTDCHAEVSLFFVFPLILTNPEKKSHSGTMWPKKP